MAPPDSRKDAVFVALRHAIIEQMIMPGSLLSPADLGEEFGIGPERTHHALMTLVEEGMAEITPGLQFHVADPQLAEAGGLFEMRRCLEADVVRRLIRRLTAGHLDAIEAHLRLQERVRVSGGARAIRVAGEFHILLAELSCPAIMVRYVRETVSRSCFVLALFARPWSADMSLREHSGIFEALRAQDTTLGMARMEHHIDLVEQRAAIDGRRSHPDFAAILRRYVEDFTR
ncbi:GntR family transcriptional regulator [Paroceanicella profunda]|uniref:GntR family transcriptional regulator n=1 Tax=Paroceanicella profunda TaxID=2579971 RepID=UPI0014796758|nr:GntR family transcriptional regulator [Paroceanicella profunda]